MNAAQWIGIGFLAWLAICIVVCVACCVVSSRAKEER